MKKIKWTGWALLGAILISINFTSCDEDYDDAALKEEMGDLSDRINALEKLCQEMNTNLTSLEKLVKVLDERDNITSITPIQKDSAEIGYTIAFAKNDPITIFHGKNGTNGTSPQLSVKMDQDSCYYWVLDGEWLLSDGQKLPVSGKNGTNGITPKFEIKEGYWFISFDKGSSWEKLGEATTEIGDFLFKSVSHTAGDVQFTLTDGTVLTVPLTQKNITSITFYSGYPDNLAIVDNESHEDGQAVLNFFIAPKEVVSDIQQNGVANVHVKAFYTPASADINWIDMPVTAIDADSINGVLTITCSGKKLSPEFYQKKQQAKIVVEIQNKEQTIASQPIAIESNKVMGNMIHYKSTQDLFSEISTSSRWNNYQITSHTTDATNRWLIFDKELTEIPAYGFSDRVVSSLLNAVYLPEGITTIGEGAFSNTVVAEVKLPEGLQTIGSEAFAYCFKLKTISLPEGLEAIDYGAFQNSGLQTITLPNALRVLGDKAFSGCAQLQSFYGKYASDDHLSLMSGDTLVTFAAGSPLKSWTVPATIKQIAPAAFENCFNLTTINLPDGLERIGNDAFSSCENLTSITLPNSVTQVETSAFAHCHALKSAVLSSSMTEIQQMTFGVCKALTDVTLPNSIKKIGTDAFTICTSLKKIDIPDSVTEIGETAFSGCTELTTIRFSENLEVIGFATFHGCNKLTELTLPASLKSIRPYAFSSCSQLKSITVKATTPPEGYNFDLEKDATIYVPAESVDAYKANETWGQYNIQPISAQ